MAELLDVVLLWVPQQGGAGEQGEWGHRLEGAPLWGVRRSLVTLSPVSAFVSNGDHDAATPHPPWGAVRLQWAQEAAPSLGDGARSLPQLCGSG